MTLSELISILHHYRALAGDQEVWVAGDILRKVDKVTVEQDPFFDKPTIILAVEDDAPRQGGGFDGRGR
ncbi:hypothetical protein [Noviherbaspirillum malthae]|uniref:hypothetical protein n=1 Tax=Noviherbaspirillum malthae TaxID=1260987 RepID=UPI00188F760F|nr:hypothetical protein [Noviherbaspirillum malthae]